MSPASEVIIEESKLREDALHEHLRLRQSEQRIVGSFGIKWIVKGPIPCPDRRSPVIQSVWIQDSGGEAFRFVTAYPQDPKTS